MLYNASNSPLAPRLMSSTWNNDWNLNSSSQQVYFPQHSSNTETLSSQNGVVEPSYDSQNMSGVNWHQNTWHSQSGHDMQPVEAWMHQAHGVEDNLPQTVNPGSSLVIATQYPGPSTIPTDTSTHVALPSPHTNFSSSNTAFPDTSSPSPTQISAADASPTTPTSFESLSASPDSPSFSVSVSEGVKYYLCECGYETTRRTDMRRHFESSKHAGQKYFCSSCGRGYTRKYNLEQHEKRHD